jgi:HD superfamily phosphodiesterase
MIDLIVNIESKWLKELYDYNYNLFSNKHIPSHNQSHHLRVWHNAKSLAMALDANQDLILTEEKLECLIIATFFHDTGITKTLDEKHGKAGKELCFKFLQKTNIDIPKGINEALTAIEFHENKEHDNIVKDKTSILAILSTADDMDAFGATGVYRYAEIYLMRNASCLILKSDTIECKMDIGI